MTTRQYKVGEPVEIKMLLEGGAEPEQSELPPVSVLARVLDSEGNQLGSTISPSVNKREINLNVPPKLVQLPGNYSALFTIRAGEKEPQDTPVFFTIEGNVVPKSEHNKQRKELKATQRRLASSEKAIAEAEARRQAESERADLYANKDAVSSSLLRKMRRKLVSSAAEIEKIIGKG
jgi:hypothetical protein